MNICVFGAASVLIDQKYIDAIEDMGEHLAKNGHNLVFGSGCTGAMGAAARGFRKGGGKTHGVVPSFFDAIFAFFAICSKLFSAITIFSNPCTIFQSSKVYHSRQTL